MFRVNARRFIKNLPTAVVAVVSVFIPILASAQISGRFTTVGSFLTYLSTSIFRSLIAIGFMVAMLVFFWGVVVFIANAGNETKLKEGKKFLLWGVITLFVLFSVWGIIRLLTATFFSSGGGGTILYF